MPQPQGVIERIAEGQEGILEASLIKLANDTTSATRRHEGRLASASKNLVAAYFEGKGNEALDAEELALLHYAQSGGEDLPSNDELAPRVEAAERAIGIISETDMLLDLVQSGSVNLKHLGDHERQLTLANRSINPGVDSAYVEIPRFGPVATFSLIGEEDLTTPIESVKGVDALFRQRRKDLLAERSFSEGPYIPLIAGSTAISRFAVDLGAKLPIRDQETDPEEGSDDASFAGFLQELDGVDSELTEAVLEEVRAAKPKLIAAIHKTLRGDLDEGLERLLESVQDEEYVNGGPLDVYDQDVLGWFEYPEVKLFYTPEELQQIKGGLVETYQVAIEKRTKEKIAQLDKQTKSTVTQFTDRLKP